MAEKIEKILDKLDEGKVLVSGGKRSCKHKMQDRVILGNIPAGVEFYTRECDKCGRQEMGTRKMSEENKKGF